ncbi:MAG: SufE family protein [Lysobacterales bacterium]
MNTSAAERQAEIVEEFGVFSDWSDRYQHLIDQGRHLPAFPEEWKTDQHRLRGCQSLVWIVTEGDRDALNFRAISDSAIVSGLVALVLRVYSGLPAAEILATEPGFIEAAGLKSHLSVTRANGLVAMLARIKEEAQRALQENC